MTGCCPAAARGEHPAPPCYSGKVRRTGARARAAGAERARRGHDLGLGSETEWPTGEREQTAGMQDGAFACSGSCLGTPFASPREVHVTRHARAPQHLPRIAHALGARHARPPTTQQTARTTRHSLAHLRSFRCLPRRSPSSIVSQWYGRGRDRW